MPNEQYLDLDGLSRFLDKLKIYIETTAPRKITCTLVDNLTQAQIADLQLGDVIVETVAGKILLVSKSTSSSKRADMIDQSDEISIRSAFFTKSNDTWGVTTGIQYLQSKITSSSKLGSDLVNDENNTNKFVTDGEKNKWNETIKKENNEITIKGKYAQITDTITALHVNATDGAFTSIALNGDDLQILLDSIVELAAGRTKNVVISDAAITGYVNSSFNSTQNTITLLKSDKIQDVDGVDVNLSDLKLGDEVYVTQTDVPDRWVGSITTTEITFFPSEINVATSVSQTDGRPVASSAVYQALQGKQDSMTAITNSEIDALFE